MIKAGVIGNPIDHSKSPRLHNHWLQILGIDGRYERIFAETTAFEDAINDLQQNNFAGVNVTIPFKEVAANLANKKSDFVKKCGSTNTLIFDDDKIAAHNTDGYGFAKNIMHTYPNWNTKGDHIVLGAGGSATAIVNWLIHAGAKSISLVNRNLERAEELAKLSLRITVYSWENLPKILEEKTTLINTTSRGMNGDNDINLDFSSAAKDMIVNDIVYTPLETGLLRSAKNAGLRTVDGLGMLLWQARPGFEAWYGAKAPEIDQGLRNFMLSKQVIALTGSIGMGKSTVAQMFKELGYEIWEADREVDRLYAGDEELYAFIREHEPAAFTPEFDKSIWRKFVFDNPKIFPELEALIHKKIRASRRAFLETEAPLKICDIPLLFETDTQHLFDKTITVTTTEDIQRERVLARGTMSETQFDEILKRQMSDLDKQSRADYVIDNSGDLKDTRVQVEKIAETLGKQYA